LLVEQNVGQSLEIADRAYVMENGLIRFKELPAELLASDTLRQAYLGMLGRHEHNKSIARRAQRQHFRFDAGAKTHCACRR
jgi:hypothetical protein